MRDCERVLGDLLEEPPELPLLLAQQVIFRLCRYLYPLVWYFETGPGNRLGEELTFSKLQAKLCLDDPLE